MLELRLIPAAHCRSILSFYKIVYNFVSCLYTFMPYIHEKNINRTAQLGHLHNPYYIRIDKLTRGHPSSRCRFSVELTKILRIM